MDDIKEAVPLRHDRNDLYKPSETVVTRLGLTQVEARGVSTLRTGKWVLAPTPNQEATPN